MTEVTSFPAVGALFAGKYQLLRVLGEGGMGRVYEALHHRMQQRVAIKVLHPDLCSKPDFVARFDREARAVARLQSDHVVRILDVDTTSNGMPFMVMECLQGCDLASELSARPELPIEEAVDLILEVAEGVAAAHEAGIVHRDLKPRNVFIAEQGGRRVVKVLDFGVSKFVGAGSDVEQTVTGTLVGTPHYMSPEQVMGDRTIDRRADVWALGVMLFRMLTRRYPFAADNPSQIAVAIVTETPTPVGLYRDVPPELASAITKALAKRREDRFADVPAFARSIAALGSQSRLRLGAPGSALGASASAATIPAATARSSRSAAADVAPPPSVPPTQTQRDGERAHAPDGAPSPSATTTTGTGAPSAKAPARSRRSVIAAGIAVVIALAAIVRGAVRSQPTSTPPPAVPTAAVSTAPPMAPTAIPPPGTAVVLPSTIPAETAPSTPLKAATPTPPSYPKRHPGASPPTSPPSTPTGSRAVPVHL